MYLISVSAICWLNGLPPALAVVEVEKEEASLSLVFLPRGGLCGGTEGAVMSPKELLLVCFTGSRSLLEFVDRVEQSDSSPLSSQSAPRGLCELGLGAGLGLVLRRCGIGLNAEEERPGCSWARRITLPVGLWGRMGFSPGGSLVICGIL